MENLLKLIPEDVKNTFENLEDILKHITDEGLDELNFKKMNVELLDKEEGRTKGLVLTLTNRKNNSFKVIVCPDMLSDDDNMRRVLYSYGKEIENVDEIPTLLN